MAFIAITLRDLRRMAVMGTLSTTLLLGVAACGSASNSGSGNPTSAAVSATATLPAAAAAPMDPTMEMPTTGPDTAPPATAATPTVDSAAAAPAAGNAVEVQATLREWGLDLSQTEVAAGTVHFVISNTGRMAHNFTIKDASGAVVGNTPNFPPTAGAQALDVTLKPGTYTVYCSLPGHAARGQQNTLTVK
jgi:plastocyanin